jgi:polysaccharide biosynthesis transport protein
VKVCTHRGMACRVPIRAADVLGSGGEMMSGMYGQNNSLSTQGGMMPYGAAMPGMGGGDSLSQIAWRGKWLILISVVLGLGGAYGYFRMLKPKCTSVSRILVEKPRTPNGFLDILQPGTTAANYLQQQASILLSRGIVGAALSDPNVLSLSSLSEESRRQALVRSLTAKVGKDDIISVTASSDDSNEPPAVINAVVRAYMGWHEANKKLSVADLLKSLQDQSKRTMDELMAKRRILAANADRDGVLESAQGGAVSKTLELLRQEVATSRLYAIQQESYCDRIKKLESDPNRLRQYVLSQGQAGNDPERTRLTDSLYETRLQLEERSAGGTVQKSQITMLENREKELVGKIARLDEKLAREQTAIAESLLEDAKKREAHFKTLYDAEIDKIRSASLANSQYDAQRTECEMLQNLYNTTLNQINSLDLNAPLEGLSIHVLEKAQLGQPAPSQMARVMGIGLVLGLMMGGALAFLRDMRDHRVRSSDEITAILGVPILGAVPTIPRRGILRRRPRTRLATGSHESEAYRSIRTALFFGASRDEGRTLLVTSPGPLEGKTTLASNLAIAMAHAGQRTLIIDADLRKPMQHRVFAKGGQGKGLVDVLTGTMTLEEVVRPTEVKGLDVLESGRVVENPSELLSSDEFAAVLDLLKSRYDRIVIDSPPVGIVADAQILAARCSLTLLVLRAQRSSRIVTQRARDALSTVSARIAGAVVNDVAKGDTRYSHYGYGAYSSYYSSHGPNGRETAHKKLPADVEPKPENEVSAPQEE